MITLVLKPTGAASAGSIQRILAHLGTYASNAVAEGTLVGFEVHTADLIELGKAQERMDNHYRLNVQELNEQMALAVEAAQIYVDHGGTLAGFAREIRRGKLDLKDLTSTYDQFRQKREATQ